MIKEGVNGTADTEGSGVDPTEPEDDPDEEPDEPKGESDAAVSNSVAAKSTIHETGNPLFVLLISLFALGFIPLRKIK